MTKKYKTIRFSQYGSATSGDDLLMFAASAKDLYAWAGIPRKGWNIRMLFQRPITPSRENELKRFWDKASNPEQGQDYIVGPTAIIIAIQDIEKIGNGDDSIDLSYTCPVNMLGPNAQVTQELAALLLPKLKRRLSGEQWQVIQERNQSPFAKLPEVDNDYVFEFCLQLHQMSFDAARFFSDNEVDQVAQEEIIGAMEAILRPAIVVDGQHRLFGAAHASKEIILPVVAIPHCPWTEQIYQFVVINEKAQKVDQSLLTDIFGSSLTQREQIEIRRKLDRSNVEIESRIAAVVAGRTKGSPFENLVQVKMDGSPPAGISPYISERTIRSLIDGSAQKHSMGWRTNEDFYNEFIAPTFPVRSDWDSWANGVWKRYWFAFWETVKQHYNEQAAKEGKLPVWRSDEVTNLTKAVTLRQVQSLFMTICVESMRVIERTRDVLIDAFGDVELADQKILEQRKAKALPADVEEFKAFVRKEFLHKGIPLKVFTANWKKSLDDAQGQVELWEALRTAFDRSRRDEQFRTIGRIFEAADDSKKS